MSLNPTSSPFYLGIAGKWIHLEGVAPGVPFARTRQSKTFQSLGGNQYSQRSAKAPGSWTLNYAYGDAEAVRWLQHAASGLAGEVWLYDVTQAQTNMLDPRDVVGRVLGAATLDVEGIALPTIASGYTITRRLRAGVTYWLGGYSDAVDGDVVLSVEYDGTGPQEIDANPGTGSRPFSGSFTPTDNFDATIAVSEPCTALRLTEGAVDQLGFMPGENTPCRVSVDDPSKSMTFAYSDIPGISNYTVIVSEVG